jgi:hypothetical protein
MRLSALALIVGIGKQHNREVRVGDAGEQEAPTASEAETPADFLTNLGNALRKKEDVDVGLADILAEHLLTAAPAVDAVAQAKEAVLKLAGERANSPKQEATDG